ncbi:flagellar filament capping protein FliD [Legionella nagasakiensis]|uniref:flagellar filament capping protein FliD n=1 Tax=Legionella nagasakiensis TaxID=535290 RepID=UPI00105545B8|nr:flagellar filament capping protein FliD [Legionella nagasakiensis]
MASVNASSGGLDIQGIVSGLMQYEQKQLNRLNQNQSVLTEKSKGYNQLSQLLTTLNSSFDKLATLLNKNAYRITSSNDNSVSALLNNTSSTAPGAHLIEVTQLAQAHKVAGAAFGERDVALGLNEALVLHNNNAEEILNVQINPTDSLEQIRDNINHSEQNTTGLVATIIATTEDGVPAYRLIIQSGLSGLSQSFAIPPESQSALLGLNQEGDELNVLVQGQDAEFKVDGFDVVRSSNTISDVLEGVSFTLNSPASSATLTVTPDNVNRADNIANALKSVVDAYNNIMSFIDKTQSQPLLKDNAFRHVKTYLHNMMNQSIGGTGGAVNSLFDLGIKLAASEKLTNSNGVEYTASGKLSFDPDVLYAALNEHYDEVAAFFAQRDFITGGETPANGFIQYLNQGITELTQIAGPLITGLNAVQQEALRNDYLINKEQERLGRVEAQLLERFTKLDTLLTMQDQKLSWLTQQLDSIENMLTKKS